MMLHRHFENENKKENLTTLADVTPDAEIEEEPKDKLFPDTPPKRGRRKRNED